MATNSRLRKDLLEKLGVSPQRLYQRIDRIKLDHGPMTTEEGTYFLAHQEKMDLSKYLDDSMVDRIRSMVQKGGGSAPTRIPRAVKKAPATRPVRISPKADVVDALLPASIANDAARMAEIYPKLYVFENSIRAVIRRVLEAEFGKDWWAERAPSDVKERVANRKKDEDKKPWHGKRGSHDIYYSDFKDLRRLIVSNWDHFKNIFPSQQWITQRLEELEPPRNVLAHHNPISTVDKNRIDLYSHDWIAQLKKVSSLVP